MNKSSNKVPRRKSGTSRAYDDDGSVTSTIKSGSAGTLTSKKKRIRVKNLKTEDENGKPGRYFGDVNEDYRPNGQGTMKYDDGTVYEGVWSEGSQVHGKRKKEKSNF